MSFLRRAEQILDLRRSLVARDIYQVKLEESIEKLHDAFDAAKLDIIGLKAQIKFLKGARAAR